MVRVAVTAVGGAELPRAADAMRDCSTATIGSVTESRRGEFSFGQRVAFWVVPKLTALLLAMVGATLRFEVIAEEGAMPAMPPARGIFCFWHRCTLPAGWYFRKFRCSILISQSFDGELIARTLALLGYGTRARVEFTGRRGGADGDARCGCAGRAGGVHGGWTAGADLPDENWAGEAGGDDGRADWVLLSVAEARVGDAVVGSVSGAAALFAGGGELGPSGGCAGGGCRCGDAGGEARRAERGAGAGAVAG